MSLRKYPVTGTVFSQIHTCHGLDSLSATLSRYALLFRPLNLLTGTPMFQWIYKYINKRKLPSFWYHQAFISPRIMTEADANLVILANIYPQHKIWGKFSRYTGFYIYPVLFIMRSFRFIFRCLTRICDHSNLDRNWGAGSVYMKEYWMLTMTGSQWEEPSRISHFRSFPLTEIKLSHQLPIMNLTSGLKPFFFIHRLWTQTSQEQ